MNKKTTTDFVGTDMMSTNIGITHLNKDKLIKTLAQIKENRK